MSISKLCSKCGQDLLLSAFYKKNKGKYGVNGRCKECVKAKVKYRTSNPKIKEEIRQKAKQRTKEYRQELRRREWAKKGKIYQPLEVKKTVTRERQALKRIARKVRLAQRRIPVRCRNMTDAELYRHKYRNDPEFNLKERLRRQLNKQKRKDKYADLMRDALKRDGNSPTITNTFGYTMSELKEHLERQFTNGMSWDAFVNGEIHIDHVKPIAAHDLTNHDELIACWSLSNLQPLWAKDNLTKGAQWSA